MEPIIFFLLIALQYFFTVYFIKNKQFNGLLVVYIYSIFSYDYVFINASYYLPSCFVIVSKLYTEYLFFFFLYYCFIILRIKLSLYNVIDRYLGLLIIIPSIFILGLNDLTRHINISESIKGMRLYLLPILLPYLFLKCNVFRQSKPTLFIYTIIMLGIIAGIYGTIQKATFYGSVHSLWFYDYFNKFPDNPISYGDYNYVRNDVLRVTSFFVSPITYSIALSFPITLLISAFFNIKYNYYDIYAKGMVALLVALFLYFQVNAETRVGIIVDLISLAIIIYTKLFNPNFKKVLLIPLSIIAFTFLTLIFGFTKELSALGRLVQYKSFFNFFKFFGLGFNDQYVLTYFDTYFMSLGLLFGIFVIFPAIFLLKINKLAFDIMKYEITNYFFVFTFTICLTFIYSFTFQFLAGSYPYKMYFILLFFTFTVYKSHDKQLQ